MPTNYGRGIGFNQPVAAPAIISPPSSAVFNTGATPAAWFGANYALYSRFTVMVTGTYRYANVYVGTSSGNVAAGVGRITDVDGSDVSFTRVGWSGVIACPAATGLRRIDCGSMTLTPGEYLLGFWCSNTTATFMHGIATGHNSRNLYAYQDAAGIPAGPQTMSPTTRWLDGLTLEAATF